MAIPIKSEFRFLVDEHGFNQVSGGDSVSYESPTLIICPSYEERDGFETRIRCPVFGQDEFYVGILLAALSDSGIAGNAYAATLKRQVSFLRANLAKFLCLPARIHNDCCELKFWHGPTWGESWGTTIMMDAATIEKEKARLVRVREFFGKPMRGNDQ